MIFSEDSMSDKENIGWIISRLTGLIKSIINQLSLVDNNSKILYIVQSYKKRDRQKMQEFKWEIRWKYREEDDIRHGRYKMQTSQAKLCFGYLINVTNNGEKLQLEIAENCKIG